MGRPKKVKDEGNKVDLADARQDKRKADCDKVVAKKRKILRSRKAATIHASPVDSKDLLRKARRKLGLVHESVAVGLRTEKNSRSKRYGDEDNIYFLTEMVKLVGSGGDGCIGARSVNMKDLHGRVRNRFGPNYTQRQVYEKARRLRLMYMNKFLARSADQRALSENSSKEEIFNLCHQLWGDCGLMKLHLEDEDVPVDRLGPSSGDAVSSHENGFHGIEGAMLGRDKEIDKGAHAEVNSSVPIVSSIHQNDSQGLNGVVPGKDMVVDMAAHAEVDDDHVASAKEMHVCLHQDVLEKQGGKVAELTAQRLDELLHTNKELVQSLEKKCDLLLEGMQVRLVAMVSNALQTRDEPLIARVLDMLKPAGLQGDGKSVDRMFTGSMQEGNVSIPKHLQDRWQRLRVDELKLVSDRLQLMLEICQSEQAKLEMQIRHQ